MTDNALATTGTDWGALERVVIQGDLSQLSPAERVNYYRLVCESVGLNPATQPFEYLKLSGKLVLYAKKDATDQLRKLHHVSVPKVTAERIEDVYVVTAQAFMPDGRVDTSTGAVSIAGLRGDALANAFMKAETKAKRRVTLSICGLGMLDESETSSVPGMTVTVTDDGEIVEAVPAAIEAPKPAPPVGKAGHQRASSVRVAEVKLLTQRADLVGDSLRRKWADLGIKVGLWSELTNDDCNALARAAQAEIAKRDAKPAIEPTPAPTTTDEEAELFGKFEDSEG